MLKARSYEEGSVHSLRRSDVMDESENRQLKTGQTYKKREITGDKSPSREIDGVVPARQSRCKHVWAPSSAGDGHGTT